MKNNYLSYDYIVNKYKNLVYYLARRLYQKSDFDDVVQAGFMGLLKACNNFDFTKSKNFKNYATKYIIFEMKKELRNKNLIHLSDYFQRIRNKINALHNYNIEDLSSIINTSVENIIIAKEQCVVFDEEIVFATSREKENKFLLFLTDEELQLYKLRIYHNLNQKEIAEYLNISQSSVSRKLSDLKIKIKELK